jgi:hypothetical protein
MTGSSFNPDAIIAKLDFFYERGKADKARRLLAEPWPAMEYDINCLYQHFLVEARAGREVPLFLKSASFDDEGLTYEFPDWLITAIRDFQARYGELEGRLRWHKAVTVFAERYSAPDGPQRFEDACATAAEKMSSN